MKKKITNKVIDDVEHVVDSVDKQVSTVLDKTNQYIQPVRRSAFRRFPTLFIVLVTFGVSATFFAFELLIVKWTYLYERPWLLLFIGLSILLGTGTLYKKLG